MAVLSTGNFDGFYRKAAFVFCLAALSLPLWNRVVNPYQVFSQALSVGEKYTSPTTNERHLKVRHLLSMTSPNGHTPPNAFLVGSSVMGLVNPNLADAYHPGLHFYNLAFLAAKPGEILSTLKAIHQGGIHIRHVIYGLEPIAFTDAGLYGPGQQLHPLASGTNPALTDIGYLSAPSLSDGLVRVAGLWDSPTIRYDIEGSGRYWLLRYDLEIKDNHKAFMLRQFPTIAKPVAAPPWLESRFSDFGKLVAWLEDTKIPSTYYLNPLHPYLASAYGNNRLGVFKTKLRKVMGDKPLIDCSGLARSIDANYWFYDYKHFRPEYAEKVFGCLKGTKNKSN